jgi:hypothetical protein
MTLPSVSARIGPATLAGAPTHPATPPPMRSER